MEYKEQTHDKIRLYVTTGELNLSQFSVLSQSNIAWNDFSVSYGILGESHFVRFENKKFALNEICACTDAHFPSDIEILESNFLTEINHLPITHSQSGHTYTFSFTVMSWEEGSVHLNTLKQKSARAESSARLSYVFPSLDIHHGESVTALFIEHAEKLNIQTVHTYPNERKMVFTESSLYHT